MYNAQIIQCADAVVAALNSATIGTFIVPFQAERKNRPLWNIAELGDLHVTVVPRTRVTEPVTRLDDQITLLIDIGIQKLFDNADHKNGDSDPLIALAEQFVEYLARLQLTSDEDANSKYQPIRTICGDEESPFYSLEHANDLETYTGVASVYYEILREVAA